MSEVSFAEIKAAARRIEPIAHRTPVMTSRTFDARSGVHAFFKCENLQRGGAFKIRGAANFIYSIPERDRSQGVVAYSSGNHAQAVAIATASVGIAATLVMPEDAPASKLAATRGYGAKVVTYDRFRQNREEIGRGIAAETGATLVPPYDHPWTINGQGTVALELLDQAPDLDMLVICVGGGGLTAGCSVVAKELRPALKIYGVEPEDGNDTYLSFRKGERVEIPTPTTIADGLRASQPGAITFPILKKNVEGVVLVTDAEIRQTMTLLLTRMKLVVEPSGAVAAAAVLFKKIPEAGGRRVGIVLSGGNVDLDVLRTLPD